MKQHLKSTVGIRTIPSDRQGKEKRKQKKEPKKSKDKEKVKLVILSINPPINQYFKYLTKVYHKEDADHEQQAGTADC